MWRSSSGHTTGVFKRFYTKVEYVPHLEDVTARVDKFTIYFPEGDSQEGLR